MVRNYRLREEAETDLERIWFYGLEQCGSDSVFYRIDGGTVEIMAIIGQQNGASVMIKQSPSISIF